jgi:FtsP/CotA-like multicopper oxidase with cupredoxin domain
MHRRHFLKLAAAGIAGGALTPFLRPPVWAQAATPSDVAATVMRAGRRTIEVKGKAASVFGLTRENGARGLVLEPGEKFNIALTNDLGEETLIHWHGLTPPWAMDGVPGNPAALLKSGETRNYLFPAGDGGTHWMHAHTLQEQKLLAAPLIVHSEEDRKRDEQEVVILLHDFTFKAPEEVLAGLKSGSPATPMNPNAMMGQMMNGPMSGMMQKHMAAMMKNGAKPGMGMMDVNDIDFDAYLANDRTLDDPELVQVEKGGRVRLRIINGATATAFAIDTGAQAGELIAVDGQPVEPVTGTLFPIAMGQRLDIVLRLPAAGGAFPVLALREGGTERTGIVLASPGAKVSRIATPGPEAAPALGLDLENQLRAVRPLAARAPDRRYALVLTGGMDGYNWAIAGDTLRVKPGERIEITMRNMSMMSHPMHMHGHHFQVTAIDGAPVAGAVRDTVLIPHMAAVTIAFDANNPGKWPLHCHQLYHMASGMMTFVAYEGVS